MDVLAADLCRTVLNADVRPLAERDRPPQRVRYLELFDSIDIRPIRRLEAPLQRKAALPFEYLTNPLAANRLDEH